MANSQSNPSFVTGQKPTAAQWNSYFTVKQDAEIPVTTITGDRSIVDGESGSIYICDTSSGEITITFDPALGSSSALFWVRFIKKSGTTNTNNVIITTDGSTLAGIIINESSTSGEGFIDIYANGTSLIACGVV